MAENTSEQIVLPERLVSSVDLSRLIRELESVDESLRQADLRKPAEEVKLDRLSATLEEIAGANHVTLTDGAQRTQFLTLLHGFKDHAPRIHMSLATEPSAKFTRKIIIWLRANIHPLILLEVGLQPTLAAGCMVRTNNKLFDMSLRHRFTENRGMLMQKIEEIGHKAEAEMTAKATAAATAALSKAASTPSAAVPPEVPPAPEPPAGAAE